ncbi:MAG: eukaryotic-like serine/threonine-protein kinase [Pseudonocardiales bacterium]|nr:eukaryotic-like serine/threonine-protein kinase [Pseudonocardiales bacterium]
MIGKARLVTVQQATPDPGVLGGRYELGALLGSGASAVVRRASDRLSGRTFAVKLFHAGASAHDRRRQQREMRALAALHHPGLVGMHDGGVEAGRPYIVTDLVEGPSLAERIAHRPLEPAEVRRIGARLADALAHVHARGIIHRDLKPANVLLGTDGRPRLADFGIARALDGTAVTGTGYVVGTAAYLAPEQVRGEWVGPAADVYALGLVLLEALTGRREYPGALVESATARLHRPPAIPDSLPSCLRTTLYAMTALEPAVRPTAAEVVALLGTGSSRRDRGGYGRGVHRLKRSRHAAVPRAVGLATALATVATITASALPSSGPAPSPGPAMSSGAVVPAPVGGPVPWTPKSAAVPVDRMADALGEGAAAARRRTATPARSLALRERPASPAPRGTTAPRSTRTSTPSDESGPSDAPGTSDAPGRHRAED